MRAFFGRLLRRWADRIDPERGSKAWHLDGAGRLHRGFARGGVIHGPGDPSDDSVPFILGQHVYPAHLVEHYGEGLVRLLSDPDGCREMLTRRCPASYGPAGCGERPCARFESDDETPWLAAERRERSEPPK